MRLLLDTHALLWFCEGDTALSETARAAIEDEGNERYVSHATAWEVAIKLNLGKLKIQAPFEDLFPGALVANGFIALEPKFEHFGNLIQLPLNHRDPFDRLIIAQATVEGPTVVTADPQFRVYGVPLLW